MKPFFFAAGALVAGIVIGAWQPRGELLALRARLDEARAERAACDTDRSAAAGIRSLLQADRLARAAQGDDPPEPDEAPPQVEAIEAEAPDAPDGERRSAEELADAATAVMDARRAQARAALAEQADLDADGVAQVDRIMDEMNAALKREVDTFVDEALEAGAIDRRDVMDFAAESLDIVIAADDAMRELLPPEALADVDDEAVDPFSYVGGDTLASLARLEGIEFPE